MKICTLEDYNFVYEFFSRDDFVGDITDDYSSNLSEVIKVLLSRDLVCMPTTGTAFVLSPINSILYSVHLNTTEEDKANVYSNTLRMAGWVKNNTEIKSVLSYIPIICESTIYYASKIGMTKIGVVPNGFLKNGMFVDNVIMSASVQTIIEELLWQQ